MRTQHSVARLGHGRVETRLVESEVTYATAKMFRQVRGMVLADFRRGLFDLRDDRVAGQLDDLSPREGRQAGKRMEVPARTAEAIEAQNLVCENVQRHPGAGVCAIPLEIDREVTTWLDWNQFDVVNGPIERTGIQIQARRELAAHRPRQRRIEQLLARSEGKHVAKHPAEGRHESDRLLVRSPVDPPLLTQIRAPVYAYRHRE
jgi:hypothetical protein